MKVPFSPPRMDQRIIDAVADVLRSGWITTGPRVRRFEELLTAFTGSQDTVCLNSGSAGLELALRWFGLGPGDEVILPAYTYAASANVVIHCGARPVFVDSLGDFNLDPAKVLEAITPRTKAVMAVDIGGWPCDYDAIRAILERPDTRNSFHPRSTVQEMLGHASIASTQVYTHLDFQHLAKVYDAAHPRAKR